MISAHHLRGTHFGNQDARLGHQEAPGFDLERDAVTDGLLDPRARAVPHLEVGVAVDPLFALAIGDRKTPTTRDRADVATQGAHLRDHRVGQLAQVLEIGAGTDVHVQADEIEFVLVDPLERVVQVLVPDAVLAELTAGIRLLAVPVAEAGIDAQPNAMTPLAAPDLRQHVGRTRIHRNVELDDAIESRRIENVGGVDELGRVALARVSDARGAHDLAERHGVHPHAELAHDPQQVRIRARLLGVANAVEGGESGHL